MHFSFTTVLLFLNILASSEIISASNEDINDGLHFSYGEISSYGENNAPKYLSAWDESRVSRKLQGNPFEFFSFIFTTVELGFDLVSIVVGDTVEVTFEIINEVVENGFSFGGIGQVIVEQIAETTVSVTTEVVEFAIENFNEVTNDLIQDLLTEIDPLDIKLHGAYQPLMTNETDCDVFYSIEKTATLYGASKINFDELDVDNFAFVDDVLTFGASGSVRADSMELEIKGEITCSLFDIPGDFFENLFGVVDDDGDGGFLGGGVVLRGGRVPANYTATVFFSDLVGVGAGEFEGVIVDDTKMNITKADFSEIGLSGYDSYTVEVSNISGSHEENIEQDVGRAITEYLDEFFVKMEEAFSDPSTLLETAGVELPVVLDLPFEWPL